MLRYQYVLAQTGAAQGDFAKTIGTWANQSRLLKESFKQVGTIVGEVIINAIKPFVAALNSALGSVISFVSTVADALGKIFGWTIEIDEGGVTNDMEDAADAYGDAGDSAGDVADGTEDAADAAKKLKKELSVLPFDELNQLAKDMEYAGNAGTGSGNGSGLDDIVTPNGEGSGLSSNFVKGEGLLDKYKSDIDSLYELGDYIGDVLTKALQKINWDKVYKAASNFGKGLADFLNGLISPELFSEVGKTIAGALNTVMHALDSFGKTFDWTNFGKSLAAGIKSFLTTYDWDLRVENFNTFANGILDAMLAALDSVSGAEWRAIPQKIADLIGQVDASGISWKIGKLANSLANAFYQIVANKSTWMELGKKLAEGINSFLSGMNAIDANTGMTGWEALGQSITKSVSGILVSITTALKGVKWKKIGQAIADFIGNINFGEITWNLGKLGNSLANALYDIISRKDIWSNLGKNIASGINNFFSAMNIVNEGGFTGWEMLGKSITKSMSGILSSIITALQGIKWDKIGQAIARFIGSIDFGKITWNLGKLVSSLASALYKLVSNRETWANLGKALADGLKGFFEGMGEIDPNTGLTGWQALGKSITASLSGIVTAIKTALEGIGFTEIGEALGNLWDALVPFAGSVGQGLVDFLNKVLGVGETFIRDTLPNGLNFIADALAKISPENAEKIGSALGAVATALVAFKGIQTVASIISSVSGALSTLGGLTSFGWLGFAGAIGAVVTALDQFGIIDVDWGAIWGGLGKIKDVLVEFIQSIEWESILEGLGGLWDAFQPFAVGFAEGLTSALDFLMNDIGAPIINGLGAAFKFLGEGLSAIPDGVLEAIGKGLGVIATSLAAINVAKGAVSILEGLFTFLGGGAISAAESAAGLLEKIVGFITAASEGTGLLQTALTGLGGGGVLGGLVLLTGKIAEFVETLRGGNGELTELGGAVDTFSGKLVESGAITSKQKDELFALKEQLEDNGATTEQFAEAFIQKLTECGVSSGQFAQAVSDMGGTMNLTDEEMKFLNQTLEGLGTSAETTAGKYVKAGTDADEAFDIIEQAIKDTADQTGDYMIVNDELLQTFRDSYDPALGNIDEAYDNVLTKLQNMGDKTEEVDGKTVLLSDTLNNNVKTALGDLAANAETTGKSLEDMGTSGETGVKTIEKECKQFSENTVPEFSEGVGTIKKEADDSFSAIDSSAGTHMESTEKKITDAYETVESESADKWGSSEDSVTGALAGIEEETNSKMSSVMTLIQQKWSSVLINTNQIWEKAAEKVETETGNMKTSVKETVDNIIELFTGNEQKLKNAGESMVRSLLSGMTGFDRYEISNALSPLISNISAAFNFNSEMYNNGKNMITSFVNGMKSTYIPTPHLTFTTNTTFTETGSKTESSSSLSWYASGGLFRFPSVIGVGESGAEAVLPLENKKAMRTISAGILSGMKDTSIGRYRLASTEDIKVTIPDMSKLAVKDSAQMKNSQVDNQALVDAIEGAVVTAMMNNQNPVNVTCYAELKTESDEVLARAVTRGQKSLDYRYNPTPKFGY